MTRCEADHSVFFFHSPPSGCIYLLVYVDDTVTSEQDQADVGTHGNNDMEGGAE